MLPPYEPLRPLDVPWVVRLYEPAPTARSLITRNSLTSFEPAIGSRSPCEPESPVPEMNTRVKSTSLTEFGPPPVVEITALRKPATVVEKLKVSENDGWVTFDPLKPMVNDPSAPVSGPVVATVA